MKHLFSAVVAAALYATAAGADDAARQVWRPDEFRWKASRVWKMPC